VPMVVSPVRRCVHDDRSMHDHTPMHNHGWWRRHDVGRDRQSDAHGYVGPPGVGGPCQGQASEAKPQ
jgi:hypothetical protein